MQKFLSILSIILLSLFLVSCSPSTTGPITSKPTTQQEVYGMDIMRFMKYTNSLNADEFVFVDTKYTIVDEAWFKANIMNGYVNFLSKNGVAFGDKKKNDCDDFARGFSFFSRVKSMQAKSLPSNLLVADVYYKTLDEGHAINAAVVLDNFGEWKLLFIEPQGPQLVNLDEEYKKFYVFHVGY